MIVKKLLVLGLISVSWFCIVSGAPSSSYSNVYVRRNAEATPVEYVNYEYEAPALALSAPLTSASVVPCVPPCVVPGQSVAAVAPLNAKLIYNSPISNVPVILPPNNDDKLSYEYSYVVYDDNSGDHKQQRELSDGSVVHGQYSLIQPDGYVREVKYTADDVKGFNAVVRNFLPSHSGEKKEESPIKSSEITPCSEVENDAFTEGLGESGESSESVENEHREKEPHEKGSLEKPSRETESHEKESHEKRSHEKGTHEKGTHEKGTHEKASHEKGSHERGSHDHGEQKSHEEKSEEPAEESHEKDHTGREKLHHGEDSKSKSSEKEASKHEKSLSSESGNASSGEDSLSSSSKEGKSKENKSKETHENVIEHHSKENKAELKSSQSSEEKSSESEEESSEEKEKSEEARSAELIPHVHHQPEHEKHHVTHEASAPPYSDFIRCIQSFMEKTKVGDHALGSNSPLAYILLPSGPC